VAQLLVYPRSKVTENVHDDGSIETGVIMTSMSLNLETRSAMLCSHQLKTWPYHSI
jgi:hypothetical protein